MNFLRKYQILIFSMTLGVFFVGMFVGFGGYLFTSKPPDAIAEVNKTPIPSRLFFSHYQRALAQASEAGGKMDEKVRAQKRDEVLRDLIQQEVFSQEADRLGIAVPDDQVAQVLAGIPAFQKDGRFDPQAYVDVLRFRLKSTPQDFEGEQRKQIAFFKLRWLVQSVIQVTDQELALAYAQRKGSLQDIEKEKAAFRDTLRQEKVLAIFNEWFQDLARRTTVKTHLELVEGRPSS